MLTNHNVLLYSLVYSSLQVYPDGARKLRFAGFLVSGGAELYGQSDIFY